MIAHKHSDVKFAHYSFDLYPIDSNHMIGHLQRFYMIWRRCLRILQNCYLRMQGRHFYMIVCWMENMSLPEPPCKLVIAKKLPPTMRVQLKQLRQGQ